MVAGVVVLVLLPALFGGVALWTRSRIERARRAAGPGGYAAFCGVSDDLQNAYLLMAGASSLAIRSANGKRAVLEVPWNQVRDATPASITLAPWRRQGLRLTVASGAEVDPAFSGRWLVNHGSGTRRRRWRRSS